jgi:flavin reductase (DIM6/NTAB) family NADH-FMN oxidoreductase RutF
VQERHFFHPGKHKPFLSHDPLSAIIGPRPIGWISSLSPDGTANLAPYSFFNAFNYRPPIIGFASVGWKDSIANIEKTREFGWSLATRPLAEAMNLSSSTAAPETDEFTLAGVEKAPSREISVPLVAASPASFECRLTQILRLENTSGEPLDSWVVFGEVVGIHIAPATVVDATYVTSLGRPILRAGGPADYFQIEEANRFLMPRP